MQGAQPWTTLDALHRESLDVLLLQQGIDERFTEEEKEELNRVWHRLLPWPDAIPGLTHLRKRFILATLSNGNIALLVDMARYSALPWDCVLSAELAHAYKPDPRVYQMAINLLGLRSHEVMMVAAHQEDLRAAQAQGMQVAFVPRPQEHGPHSVPDLAPDPAFQLLATDLSQFGAATRRLKAARYTYACSCVTNASACWASSSQSAACSGGTSTHAFMGRPCIGSKSCAPGSASALVCAAPPSLKTIAS